MVWCATGPVAYQLSKTLARLPQWIAAVGLAFAGAYQLTPLKHRCLRHCRAPLSTLLRTRSFRGPLRDVLAGVWHGAYCVGCCAGMMLAALLAGLTSVATMLLVTSLIVAAKRLPHGHLTARLLGLGLLTAAILALAGGSISLDQHSPMSMPAMLHRP